MDTCCNCGGSLSPSVIPYGDEGEAVCSTACWNAHETLGCPLEHGTDWRSPPSTKE